MTKVEEVARAIYGTTALSQTTPQWESVRYELKDLFLRQAQVAIEAMRESPPELVSPLLVGQEGRTYYAEVDAGAGRQIWNAMIDAALAEDAD